MARYLTCWHSAHPYGVGGYDGIVLLVCALPNEWSEWAQATARRFYRRNPPSVALDGDMKGFAKSMFDVLVDHPKRPPPASTVEPPTGQLDLPLWTIPGREQGESSRSARAKRVRTEDRDRYDSKEEESDEESEYEDEVEDDEHELGNGVEGERERAEEDRKGKAALEEEEDPDEDEDPEEEPYTENSGIEETMFVPPPPFEPPPTIPPPPYEAAYEYLPPLPPSGPFYYVDFTIPTGYGYGAHPGPTYYLATPETPEPILETAIPEEELSPIVEEVFPDIPGRTVEDPIWIPSDSETDE